MGDAIQKAQALLDRGDIEEAATSLQIAERKGDALAARELALWYLTGQLIRRDLAASRTLFERAAALGDQASAPIARAFIAAGIGKPADWPGAMTMLREAAPSDPSAAAQLALINAMEIGTSGEPLADFHAESLSASPEIRLYRGLFSKEECEYLINVAKPALRPSVVVDPSTGRQTANPIRTSSAAGFPFIDENPAIHALNRRIAAASGTDVRSGEPLQVLCYAPGQEYRPHSDALPGVAPEQQRIITFLVYLNEGYEGGETAFPAVGLKFRGRPGDGILFRNSLPDGRLDQRAIHSGEPVTSGMKHIASRWIRAAPLILE